MDPKKAFGLEQALGRAIAKTPGGADALRGFASKEDLRHWVAEHPVNVPPGFVEGYLAALSEQDWPKARAKLLLAVKLALGEIQRAHGHEAGRGVRKG